MKKKNKNAKPVAKNCKCGKPLYPLADHFALCPLSTAIAKTINGRIIADLMHAQKKRGNHRDWVIFSGASMLEYTGTYQINVTEGGKLAFAGVQLVHKRNLHRFIGDEAKRFWRPGVGRMSESARENYNGTT